MNLHDLGVLLIGVALGMMMIAAFSRPALRLKIGLIEVSGNTIEDIEALLNLRPVEEFKP